jgi:hypothetical protein
MLEPLIEKTFNGLDIKVRAHEELTSFRIVADPVRMVANDNHRPSEALVYAQRYMDAVRRNLELPESAQISLAEVKRGKAVELVVTGINAGPGEPWRKRELIQQAFEAAHAAAVEDITMDTPEKHDLQGRLILPPARSRGW